MPNHVTTELKAPKHVLDALVSHEPLPVEPDWIAYIKDETKREVKRKAWWDEHGEKAKADAEEKARIGYVDFNLLIPQPPNIEKGGCTGEHPPGVVCWYKWNTQNWGTKWNGYSTERLDDTTIRFDTAWSHPEPVIRALSEKFPDAQIYVAFADEDIGHNVAAYQILDGELATLNQPVGGSDEAYEMAAQIKHKKTYAELKAEWERYE